MNHSRHDIDEILINLGFSALNPMQHMMVSVSDEEKNVLLLAPTGSGKTLAFLLQAYRLMKEKNSPELLIVTPTRELALQIEDTVKKMKLNIKSNAVYGGHKFEIEKRNFSDPPSILIGTPGRLVDHIKRATFDPSPIDIVILDEFDKSLELGFNDEIEFIFSSLKRPKRKILVSATDALTIPPYLNFLKPTKIDFLHTEQSSLKLHKIRFEQEEKLETLELVLNQLKENQNAIVFSNHRNACDRISRHLENIQFQHALYHGGLDQSEREESLIKFRNGSAPVLIATDLAARGLDIPSLDYVIHYQLPHDQTSYVHRNGRTARMKSSGTALLFLASGASIPDYIDKAIPDFELDEYLTPPKSQFLTLHINRGKKNKINKGDLLGYFLQFKEMIKDDVGLIVVKDYNSYVAINRAKTKFLLKATKGLKIKNKQVRISILS